jgi:spore germination protein GerM
MGKGITMDSKRMELMMTDKRIRMIALLGALTLVLLTACSNESPAPDTSEAASNEEQTPSEEPTEEPSPTDEPEDEETETVSFEVWFAKGRRLAPAVASVEATPRVGAAALETLLAGPPEGGELTTEIPDETRVNSLNIERGMATVDLSSSFESGSGVPSMGMRLGQLTFTLTQFPTVKRVALELDGEPVDTFSNAGLVIEKPLKRTDFEDLSPAIVVSRPLTESEVSSPVMISGTANVFEANVSIRVVTSNGEVLAETFTTATCGTGCRGAFSKRVEIDVEEPTEATIEVYEESAETGRPVNKIEVPVTLLP